MREVRCQSGTGKGLQIEVQHEVVQVSKITFADVIALFLIACEKLEMGPWEKLEAPAVRLSLGGVVCPVGLGRLEGEKGDHSFVDLIIQAVRIHKSLRHIFRRAVFAFLVESFGHQVELFIVCEDEPWAHDVPVSGYLFTMVKSRPNFLSPEKSVLRRDRLRLLRSIGSFIPISSENGRRKKAQVPQVIGSFDVIGLGILSESQVPVCVTCVIRSVETEVPRKLTRSQGKFLSRLPKEIMSP